jgi:ribosomal protein S18 acetylase RimI-like enzyme
VNGARVGQLDSIVVMVPGDSGLSRPLSLPGSLILNRRSGRRSSPGPARAVRYTALRDGITAGGATMRIADGIAQLTGAATAPAHRRRGVHTALLSARLADAAAAGCDVAVITTQPGSKSQQNAQRQNFDLLYARAVLVKP